MTPSDALGLAIEVMTAWASDPDGDDRFVQDRVLSALGHSRQSADVVSADELVQEAFGLIGGFINLTGLLLTIRESEAGVEDLATLQDIALRFGQQGGALG